MSDLQKSADYLEEAHEITSRLIELQELVNRALVYYRDTGYLVPKALLTDPFNSERLEDLLEKYRTIPPDSVRYPKEAA